ncbi:DeoR/GlpR family DNA-binding transcription regulator [Paenibacillus sp. SEL3]
MLPGERRNIIIDLALQDKRVLVSDLSREFGVTEETIRRDLEKLEKEGILTRTYGGAVISRHTSEDLPFNTRNSLNTDMKHSIALKAFDLISDGDTLMVDASSTTFELVKLLSNKRNLTIITNSVHLLHKFSTTALNIISSGGSLRHRSHSLVGAVACNTIERYHVDTVIISCKGIDLKNGITDSNEPESDLKRCMLRQASQIILLADHTKFDNTAFIRLSEIYQIDVLVTDCMPSEVWMNFFKENSVEVIY